MHRTPLHRSLPLFVPLALALGAVAGPLRVDDADARPVRGGARTSVNRSAHASRNVNVNRNVNRNVNVHRDIDVDVDHGHYRGGHYHGGYHPVARAAAATAAVAVTAAAIGSIVYSLPPDCVTVMSAGVTYQRCGSAYYQPRYSGTQVTYVVVAAP